MSGRTRRSAPTTGAYTFSGFCGSSRNPLPADAQQNRKNTSVGLRKVSGRVPTNGPLESRQIDWVFYLCSSVFIGG
ncbi:exported hypothetical protein [Candidatus Sulfopaludibacter sp. SbA4]|nr:exported hypothetical protein [Candidatus Sulfopaludibacter sp. SbA4]